MPRDLLVVAAIHTLDPLRPWAGAVLVQDGRIARIGSPAECRQAAQGTPEVIAPARGCAVPGLVDAHGHVLLLARARAEVRCAGARDPEACAALAASRARDLPPGTWVRGRGWDQNRWGGAFPGADVLDRAVPDHPVALFRVDGHAAWANRRALALAGIGPDTPDPAGGRILRNAAGSPTGVLVDNAMEPLLAAIPRPGPRELEGLLETGLGELASLGLTGVHDAGVEPDALDAYARLAGAGRLPVRVRAMIDGQVPPERLRGELERWRAQADQERLEVRTVKLFADGALGSRGAALLDDYADDPGNRGLLLMDPGELAERISLVAEAGFQPAIHAIGDRACRLALDSFEAGGPALRALRPRIEHLQILQPSELPRLARLGVVASMQPVHAVSDASWVPDRLGQGTARLGCAYAWRSVADAGAVLAFGSDFPVEEPDPRAGLHAAEVRRGADGRPFLPEQRLGRAEALAAFTRGAAWAAFAEGRRGKIREGFDADLTIFAEDAMTVPADELPRLPITHTIVGGEVVFTRGP
jgi:predicted amidohydrolase YtcJ